MDTAWLIYFYILIGNLEWVVAVPWAMLGAAALFYLIEGTADGFDGELCKSLKGFMRKVGPVAVILGVLASAYPSKTDLAYIFGGAALISVAQNEEAQKLPDNILKAVNVFLEGVAEEEK